MASLQHLLVPDPPSGSPHHAAPTPPTPPPPPLPAADPPVMPPGSNGRPPHDRPEDENADTPRSDAPDEHGTSTPTVASVRRNASGTVSSVFAGNKVRHLKKEDGIPLWRKDIQYDFLCRVFHDETKCFTKASDGTTGHTFADVYIDAMAKSSKCSKILKEKLLQDREGAICMAMVCLLVNVGRMNTTLNFFPEMRAQLRTYHSIPALQAHQDPSAYKQLQDAPRLKSILKGATEDEPQPSTLEEIREATKPRTNPVNLVFVLSQYAPKVTERHFHSPRDFFDLVMRPSITSASRARAFLWLIWWYLESDFGIDGSRTNPFGQGGYGAGEESGTAVPEKVPELETMTDAQTALENVDTEEEERFGEIKRKERIAILASEPSPAMTALKRARREKGAIAGLGAPESGDEAGSDTGYWKTEYRNQITSAGRLGETASEYTRSPSPPMSSRAVSTVNAATPAKPASDMRIHDILNNEETEGSPTRGATAATAVAAPAPIKKGPGRGNWRRNKPKQESAASTRGGDGLHNHVPLLPNNGPQSISFVNEGPVPLRPNTPGSSLQQLNGGQMSPPTTISFQPPNTRDHVPTPSYQVQKRHRGVTTHQSALASHRKQQVDYTLDRRIRKLHAVARERREAEGAILRSWKRLCTIPPDYDSEEESIKIRRAKERNEKGADDDWRAVNHHHHKGGGGGGGGGGGKANALELLGDLESIRRPKTLYAGLAPTAGEAEDIGEEPKHIARVIRRASRRLERWQESPTPGMAMIQRRQMQLQDESRAPTPVAQRRKPAARRHTPHREPSESDPMEADEEEDNAQVVGQSTQYRRRRRRRRRSRDASEHRHQQQQQQQQPQAQQEDRQATRNRDNQDDNDDDDDDDDDDPRNGGEETSRALKNESLNGHGDGDGDGDGDSEDSEEKDDPDDDGDEIMRDD